MERGREMGVCTGSSVAWAVTCVALSPGFPIPQAASHANSSPDGPVLWHDLRVIPGVSFFS